MVSETFDHPFSYAIVDVHLRCGQNCCFVVAEVDLFLLRMTSFGHQCQMMRTNCLSYCHQCSTMKTFFFFLPELERFDDVLIWDSFFVFDVMLSFRCAWDKDVDDVD